MNATGVNPFIATGLAFLFIIILFIIINIKEKNKIIDIEIKNIVNNKEEIFGKQEGGDKT